MSHDGESRSHAASRSDAQNSADPQGSGPQQPDGALQGKRESARAENDAWGITATLLAGPIAWGAIGWLADRWLGTQFLLPLGLMVGMAAALYLIWVRYGRS